VSSSYTVTADELANGRYVSHKQAPRNSGSWRAWQSGFSQSGKKTANKETDQSHQLFTQPSHECTNVQCWTTSNAVDIQTNYNRLRCHLRCEAVWFQLNGLSGMQTSMGWNCPKRERCSIRQVWTKLSTSL